jgi:hypothetical protein
MRPSPLRAAVLATAVALAACSGGAPGRPPPTTELTGTLVVTGDGAAAARFSLASMTALTVEARIHAPTPCARPLRVDVVAPSGDLYAQLRGDAQPDASGDAALTRVLEVRGTPIDRYRQTGAWRFVLAVEDGPALAEAAVVLAE